MMKSNQQLRSNLEVSGRDTRHKNDIHIDRRRTQRTLNNTINSAVDTFNALPAELKKIADYKKFVIQVIGTFKRNQNEM